MKLLSSALLAAGLFTAAVSSQAATSHFEGSIADQADVIWGTFTVTDYASYDSVNLLFTDSYGEGNFDPILFLWDSYGTLIEANDDGGPYWDAMIVRSGDTALAAGDYYFSITHFPNWNKGSNLTNGFNYDGQTRGAPSLGADWSLYVTGVSEASILPGAPVVPEPETYAMLLAGLGLVGVVARRRRQR
ncbi:MAG: DVUA0089 family protein [Azoarcus sp.]|jgi:hypothetical protein|nr:DVUA0089 family protein [Azoarcus sp.]